MDCVGGDGEHGALWEVVIADGDAGARRDDAREAEGGGGVDAEGFGYHPMETVDISSALHFQETGQRKRQPLEKRGGAH